MREPAFAGDRLGRPLAAVDDEALADLRLLDSVLASAACESLKFFPAGIPDKIAKDYGLRGQVNCCYWISVLSVVNLHRIKVPHGFR
jgi:hypothetical protein